MHNVVRLLKICFHPRCCLIELESKGLKFKVRESKQRYDVIENVLLSTFPVNKPQIPQLYLRIFSHDRCIHNRFSL